MRYQPFHFIGHHPVSARIPNGVTGCDWQPSRPATAEDFRLGLARNHAPQFLVVDHLERELRSVDHTTGAGRGQLCILTVTPFDLAGGDSASDPVVLKDKAVAVAVSAAPEPDAAAVPCNHLVTGRNVGGPCPRHVRSLHGRGGGEPK